MRCASVRIVIPTAVVAVMLALVASASAGPFSALAPIDISAGDPYAACPPIGAGVNYPDAEVEPFVDVNPTGPANIVASTSRTATATAARRATSRARASTAA